MRRTRIFGGISIKTSPISIKPSFSTPPPPSHKINSIFKYWMLYQISVDLFIRSWWSRFHWFNLFLQSTGHSRRTPVMMEDIRPTTETIKHSIHSLKNGSTIETIDPHDFFWDWGEWVMLEKWLKRFPE